MTFMGSGYLSSGPCACCWCDSSTTKPFFRAMRWCVCVCVCVRVLFAFVLLDFSSALYEMVFKEPEQQVFGNLQKACLIPALQIHLWGWSSEWLGRLEHLVFFRESGSVPSTHVGCLTTVFSSSFQGPSALFWPSWAHEHMRVCTHIYRDILIYLKVFSLLCFFGVCAYEHSCQNRKPDQGNRCL